MLIYQRGSDTIHLLLYVDDIVLNASSLSLLHWIIMALQHEFTIKDLDPLHHFLGIVVEHRPDGLFLQQHHYTLNILEHSSMLECKSCVTMVDAHAKVSGDELISVTPLPIGALPVFFGTSPSLGPTSHMLFSRFVFTCMILGSHTSPR